jgi:hypothetical protein
MGAEVYPKFFRARVEQAEFRIPGNAQTGS